MKMLATNSQEIETIDYKYINTDQHYIIRLCSILHPEIIVSDTLGRFHWIDIRTQRVVSTFVNLHDELDESIELKYPIYVYDNIHEYLEDLANFLDV